MPGFISTSSSYQVACNFLGLDREQEDDTLPVLFVFVLRNYRGLKGAFRLNQPEYTAYLNEQETLLIDGFQVYVLDVKVKEDVTIGNHNTALTVITLFHKESGIQ